MSMWLEFVRLRPAEFEKVEKTPSLLAAVLCGDPQQPNALGVLDADRGELDYRVAERALQTADAAPADRLLAAALSASPNPVFRDLGASGALEYDAGYDDAFFVTPAAISAALGHSRVLEVDPHLAALYRAAAERGDYIVGLVS